MLLAFYRSKFGTLLDRWISLATWGPFSHCEFVFREHVWFSSSPRDGGVRCMTWPINEEQQRNHWVYVPVQVDDRQLFYWCESQLGKRYDWLGAVLRLPVMNDRWFCSEFCIAGLQHCGVQLPITQWASPNQLYRAITKAQYGPR